MIHRPGKAPPAGRYYWVMLFLGLHGAAHFQVLQSVIKVDTRLLFTTSYELPGTQSTRYLNPLQLASVVNLKVQTDTYYDDVYRARGSLEGSEVYRMGNVSYFEIPVGAEWGGVGCEFVHTEAYATQSNRYEEKSTFEWIDQRGSVAIGGNALQRRLRFGSLAGFTRLDEEWQPHYAAELAWQPQMTLNLALKIGRQPGYRNVEWLAENHSYPATVDYIGRWWGAAVRFGFLEYTNLMVETRRERLCPANYDNNQEGLVLEPEILLRSLRARAQVRPSATSSLYFKWYTSSVTGNAEAFENGRKFGELASLVMDNSELELIGTWRHSKRTLFIFTYSQCNLDARQSSHLDPWPFSASVFSQFKRIYYRGSGQVRAERVIAEYVMSRRWIETAVQLGRVWLVPDPETELEQRRTMLIFFDLESVSSSLNILRAEFTVVGGRLSISLGKLAVSYYLNQAIPTNVEKREVPPAGPADEKTDIRGGSYHRLRLTFTL